MKIVFMGTPDFSVPILRGLVEEGYQVEAVVTRPDRPKGRKKTLTPPPVKEEAVKHGLRVFQPETLRQEENVQEILAVEPDLIITAAYGQILPESILNAPSHRAINVHASLLPQYRGGAPIHQAIIDGNKKTGITIMYMVKQLDAGDILTQKEVEITDNDTTGSLHDKLSLAGKDLLLETLPLLIKGEITPQSQNEEEATYAPNIKRGQEKIDWNQPGQAIYNHIRGMNPWPVAYTTYQGKPFKIWEAKKMPSQEFDSFLPGTIVAEKEDGLLVKTGDQTAINIQEIQPSGKKRMKAADFLRGNHGLKTGEQFDNDE